jgi:hypothetical protein
VSSSTIFDSTSSALPGITATNGTPKVDGTKVSSTVMSILFEYDLTVAAYKSDPRTQRFVQLLLERRRARRKELRNQAILRDESAADISALQRVAQTDRRKQQQPAAPRASRPKTPQKAPA